jgi:hypothetical protein
MSNIIDMLYLTYPTMIEDARGCADTGAESRFSWPQPGKLWSLWDMYEFKASQLYLAFQQLGRIDTLFEYAFTDENTNWDDPVSEENRLQGDFAMRMVLEDISKLPTPVTQLALEELLRALKVPKTSYTEMKSRVSEINNTLRRELKTVQLYSVDAKYSDYLRSYEPGEVPASLFGEAVELKFPDAQDDILEASRCLALRRNTACVFHLMRAMESTVSVLAQKTQATLTNCHGETLAWGVLVGNLKSKIEAMPKGQNQDDWLAAHSMLHSVNRAFRTKTAHPEKTYTDEQAESAFQAVKAFMQELAALV